MILKKKKEILFGRKKGVDIECNSEGVSRIQCNIFFDKNEQKWYMVDGVYGKPSRNGIWLLSTKQMWIESDIVFKTGFSTFKATII